MGYRYDIVDSVKKARRARSLSWLIPHLLRQRRLIEVDIDGLRLHVRTTTPDLGIALALPTEFNSMFELMPRLRHNLIIDAGGYIGTAAIAFARHYPEAKVVTLEPSPDNFAVLCRNVAGFPNIVPLNMALAPVRGERQLFDRGRGEWGFTLVERAADYATKPLGTIEATTVDDIISEAGTDGVDIVKLDIEGGEAALLSENTGWIDRTEAVCIELHDRIVPGCSRIWEAATAGRRNGKLGWEKQFSLREG